MPLESGSPAAAVNGDPGVRFWERRVWRAQILVNFAWWIETLLPAAFIASIVFTVFVLAGRREEMSPSGLQIAGTAALIAALLSSFLRARSHFLSRSQVRAQLDCALSLQSRLSAAADGVGRWPEATAGRAWKWNSRKLVVIPLACAGLIAASFLVRIEPRHKSLPLPTAKPPALAQVEDWLQKLAQSPAIDPASLEQPRQEAEQLARQQAQDWYSHASLEAADHLKTQVEAGMRTMEKNAAKIDGALGAALRAELSDSQANALGAELKGALRAMEGNVPSLDRSLTSKLGQIDPSKLRSLSRDQIKELQKRLCESKGACENCLGNGDSDSDEESKSGLSSNDGNAGVDRGPGAAPMTFNLSGSQLGSKKTEAMENDDLTHAALGDRVGISSGQHDVDRNSDPSTKEGGTAGKEGAGAGAVWLDQNLRPDERRQLQQFFK